MGGYKGLEQGVARCGRPIAESYGHGGSRGHQMPSGWGLASRWVSPVYGAWLLLDWLSDGRLVDGVSQSASAFRLKRSLAGRWRAGRGAREPAVLAAKWCLQAHGRPTLGLGVLCKVKVGLGHTVRVVVRTGGSS